MVCVHHGRPYEDKPRLCLDESVFADSSGEVFKVERGRVRRRAEGRESSLTITSRGYVYDDGKTHVKMDRGFKVVSADGTREAGTFSLRGALEMWTVYSGVENSLPWLLDY